MNRNQWTFYQPVTNVAVNILLYFFASFNISDHFALNYNNMYMSSLIYNFTINNYECFLVQIMLLWVLIFTVFIHKLSRSNLEKENSHIWVLRLLLYPLYQFFVLINVKDSLSFFEYCFDLWLILRGKDWMWTCKTQCNKWHIKKM